MSALSGSFPSRTAIELQELQRQGQLQVATADAFRALVAQQGLEQAYRHTHVVVASGAEFTSQASLLLQLGPTDPPMRIHRFRLGPAEGQGGHGNTDLLLPLGQGGALALEALLRGETLPFSASGSGGPQQPRLELETQLNLERIGAGRLLLHRGVVENGVVAVSSREGLTPTPWGPVLGPLVSGLYSCGGAGSIGLAMPGLTGLGPGSPLLVAGGLGWVSGAGSGHNPEVKRQADGQALSPGACAAVEVDLHALNPRWLRATRLGEGTPGCWWPWRRRCHCWMATGPGTRRWTTTKWRPPCWITASRGGCGPALAGPATASCAADGCSWGNGSSAAPRPTARGWRRRSPQSWWSSCRAGTSPCVPPWPRCPNGLRCSRLIDGTAQKRP